MDFSTIIVIVCVVLAVVLLVVYALYGRSEANFTLDIGGSSPRASGGSDNSNDKNFSSSITGFTVLSGSVFAVLLAKLFSMQVVNSDDWSSQAESNRTTTVYTAAPRGRILDRNGNELVINRSSLTVVAEAEAVDDEIEMQLLANLIGMPYQAVRRNIQDTTGGAQSARSVAVDVSRRVVAFIGEHETVFPDVDVEQRSQRSYPYDTLASHVVGYTGTVTSDQLSAETEDGDVEYRSGDIVGQAGIESEYESVLAGVRGEQTVYVDADGNVLDYSTTIEPQSGSDVVLTLDIDIQQAAETSLEETIAQNKSEGCPATGGAVICMDCTSGEILAMASYPTYSPSLFTGGISTADYTALTDESANYPLMNRAIAGQYPSGSVIKPLTTFAALDYGIATAESSWYCTGWWTGFGEDYGKACWTSSGHGTVNLIRGITYSCDIVYYEIGKGFYYDDDNPEGMQEKFREFGLGSKAGLDLPSEAAGRVPDAEWKWEYWSDYDDDARTWQGGDNCNIAIGQGDMLVTLLQMVDAYCGIANRGPIYRPHLMKGVRSRAGEGTVIDYDCEVIYETEEPDDYRDLVASGMYGVTYEESSSQASHWTNLSVTVHSKTGTAQQSKDYPVGWFIAYAPADDPKYVVGSFIDEVNYGSTSAMYVVRDVLGQIYGEPDDSEATSTSGE